MKFPTHFLRRIGAIVALAASLLVYGSAAASASYPLLHIGSRGAAVVQLQRGLNIQADGFYGPSTAAAVTYLQAKYGLATDGVTGASTWRAWSSHGSMSSVLASFSSSTLAGARWTGWAVETRLNGSTGNTRVIHYSRGHWSLALATPSSSAGWARDTHGKLRHYSTCTGVYSLHYRDPRGPRAYSATYGHAPMPWAVYWCGGDAFHEDGLSASHGCVHIPAYALARSIYLLPLGTLVDSIGLTN